MNAANKLGPVAARRAWRGTAYFLCAAIIAVAAPGRVLADPVPQPFAELSARLLPAVINISTSQTIKSDHD